ncbi:hypothetical protein JQ600_34150, partial [Bradyrhizobium sp. AUGA SZCCT0176]
MSLIALCHIATAGKVRQINPTGKSILSFRNRVKKKISVNQNISVVDRPKSVRIYRHPVLLRRASAVVTDVGRVAVDAGLRLDDGVD